MCFMLYNKEEPVILPGGTYFDTGTGGSNVEHILGDDFT